jgi:hypothetical protein
MAADRHKAKNRNEKDETIQRRIEKWKMMSPSL